MAASENVIDDPLLLSPKSMEAEMQLEQRSWGYWSTR